ncbi:UNVERIFIED_CONTAM: hypothetical protein GTU68_067510 [Idotea baltica]|nr:hypothetical protein [Idotea baltica]
MLEVNGLSKSFQGTTVLKDLNFRVKAGELFVILGPSGSGKSTLLRIIAGLETPDLGEIKYDSKDWTSLQPKERNIAFVFQDYALYPNMTVLENIEYPLKIRQIPKPQRIKETEEAAKHLEIQHLLNRSVKKLSGGEAQRVALARALVRKPNCILMDEPLSNLDMSLRYRAKFLIKKIQKDIGCPIIYVTHDQNEALSLSDRVMILNGGNAQQIGTIEDFRIDPQNIFVAKFWNVPPRNLIPIESLVQLGIDVHVISEKINNREGIVSIPSKDVKITQANTGSNISAEIIFEENYGGISIFACQTSFGILFAASNSQWPKRAKVSLEINMDQTVYFDSKTGNRIL